MNRTHAKLSVSRQCELLGLSKGGLYYQPVEESAENLEIMDELDRQALKTPFYGSRRMQVHLNSLGYQVNRKRVQRLMRKMGLETIYPKPRTTQREASHQVYPYLLKGVAITEVNQVWSSDITYIRIEKGFVYLTAIIDWFSRYVLSWKLSNSLDAWFCVETLEVALQRGTPQIFNTDQGVQYTSQGFLQPLLDNKIRISMDSKGRALDNIFVERLWRSLKYEEVYLRSYCSVREAEQSIEAYFRFYNQERPHQSLEYQTPQMVYLYKKQT